MHELIERALKLVEEAEKRNEEFEGCSCISSYQWEPLDRQREHLEELRNILQELREEAQKK